MKPKKSDLQSIKDSIKELKNMTSDDEMAHGFEDDLYKKVLRKISNGAKNPKELAKEVLKAGKINFARWCA